MNILANAEENQSSVDAVDTPILSVKSQKGIRLVGWFYFRINQQFKNTVKPCYKEVGYNKTLL